MTAIRQLLATDDPDAPPPKWMAMTASMTPLKAFLVGAGILAIGAKFWVFTLGAVATIADADVGSVAAIGTFVLFAVLAEIVHLAILSIAIVAPRRSAGRLDQASGWLHGHNRVIVIILGAVFGTWFLLKGLDGLGVA